MADPLSIVGTVAGLVVLGAKLACKATTFVGDVSSASEDIGAVLTELHALCGVLSKLERLLRDELKQGTGQGVIPTELSADLSLVLDSCMDLFVKLQLFLERYSTKQGNGLLAVKWKQMKWVIKEKDLKNLRVGLAAHKATLNVTLGLASCIISSRIDATTNRIEATNNDIIARLDQMLEDSREEILSVSDDNASGIILRRFLADTTSYAGSVTAGSVYAPSVRSPSPPARTSTMDPDFGFGPHEPERLSDVPEQDEHDSSTSVPPSMHRNPKNIDGFREVGHDSSGNDHNVKQGEHHNTSQNYEGPGPGHINNEKQEEENNIWYSCPPSPVSMYDEQDESQDRQSDYPYGVIIDDREETETLVRGSTTEAKEVRQLQEESVPNLFLHLGFYDLKALPPNVDFARFGVFLWYLISWMSYSLEKHTMPLSQQRFRTWAEEKNYTSSKRVFKTPKRARNLIDRDLLKSLTRLGLLIPVETSKSTYLLSSLSKKILCCDMTTKGVSEDNGYNVCCDDEHVEIGCKVLKECSNVGFGYDLTAWPDIPELENVEVSDKILWRSRWSPLYYSSAMHRIIQNDSMFDSVKSQLPTEPIELDAVENRLNLMQVLQKTRPMDAVYAGYGIRSLLKLLIDSIPTGPLWEQPLAESRPGHLLHIHQHISGTLWKNHEPMYPGGLGWRNPDRPPEQWRCAFPTSSFLTAADRSERISTLENLFTAAKPNSPPGVESMLKEFVRLGFVLPSISRRLNLQAEIRRLQKISDDLEPKLGEDTGRVGEDTGRLSLSLFQENLEQGITEWTPLAHLLAEGKKADTAKRM